jgi:hypothetical protein
LFIAFIATVPSLAQVEPSATGNGGGSLDESEMMTPPPVSGMPYANAPGGDTRSNYLAASVSFSPAYIENLLPGSNDLPVDAVNYSIFPSVSLDHSTPRQLEQLTYSPSFNLYQATNNPNSTQIGNFDSIDQNAAVTFQYRFNPRVTFSALDSFTRTSDVFNSTYLSSGTISGSTTSLAPTVIAPFAEQLMNTAGGLLTYQFGRNAMIGGGGSYNTFSFPNPTQAVGLYNSNGAGGNAFYNRRLSRAQYLGLQYQYARILTYPSNGVSETQIQSLLPFYTFYFNQAFSFSVSAGIDYVDTTAPQAPESKSWSPTAVASFGWQGKRGNLAASFSRSISTGQDLLGAYNSNSISASGGWKLARTWTGELTVAYTAIGSVTPLNISSVQSGNTLAFVGSIQRSVGERFSAGFQYQRLQENYTAIAVVSANPDSNRVSANITYQLRRPIGR